VERLAGAEQTGRTCPYCRFSFKPGVSLMECGSCKALHHSECWQENGGCAVTACPSAPDAAGAPVTSPPPTAQAAPAPAQPVPPQPVPPQPASPQPVPPRAAAAPASQLPSAGAFAAQVRAWLATPLVATAALTALVAATVMAAVGFIAAIGSPEASYIGAAGLGSSLFDETVRLTVATMLARFGSSGFHYSMLPLLFVAAPIGGAAYGALRNAHRTAALPPRQRIAAGALAGVPLAALMLVASAFADQGELGFTAGSVILYSIAWGGLGGAAGAAIAIGPQDRHALVAAVPARADRYLRLAWTALKPLGLLLAIAGVVAVAAWTVQTARGNTVDAGYRAMPTALVENVLYGGDLAIAVTALGSLAQFEPLAEDASSRSLPLPLRDLTTFDGFGERWRIFAYGDNYPAYAFVFMLILLIGLPLALAAYGGFSLAAAAMARTPGAAAAHGALIGVVWAIALSLLRAIADMQPIVGDSLFTSVLIGGAAAGAVGGLLALRQTE
jgi:hypothetical protein